MGKEERKGEFSGCVASALAELAKLRPSPCIHWSAPHLVLRWRCLGPWRTLDAPESPRVGCNCGLVALEAARCRLDSKYLESTSHLI